MIEAGPEDLAVKHEIFAELIERAPDGAVLATNTSAIPIHGSPPGADRERVLGTHFWNPPHLIPLVEVVQGERPTRGWGRCVLRGAAGAGPRQGRRPRFIGNRLQHALKREAIAIVADGICDAETLDAVVRQGFGARLGVIGPLEQSDLGGLELTLAIHEALMPALDRTPVAHPLVARRSSEASPVRAGRGFRSWSPGGRGAARPGRHRAASCRPPEIFCRRAPAPRLPPPSITARRCGASAGCG